MALWKGLIDTWKVAWKHGWQVITGWITSPSFSSESERASRKTCPVLHISWVGLWDDTPPTRRLFCPTYWGGRLLVRLTAAYYHAPPADHTYDMARQPQCLTTPWSSFCYPRLLYVRHDGHKPPLTRPYEGAFRVVRRLDKHFTLDINGKLMEVTVDRLKPAKLTRDHDTLISDSPEDSSLPPSSFTAHSPSLLSRDRVCSPELTA